MIGWYDGANKTADEENDPQRVDEEVDMADPIAIINRKNTTGFDYFGTTTLIADGWCIIWTHGFPCSIGVIGSKEEEATVAFMVSEITDTEQDIRGDSYTAIDLAVSPYTVDKIVEGKIGVSAYKVVNGSSSDPIKVNWRIVRP